VYPATLKKKDWFQEYSSHLNSVEENHTFQCMPSPASVQKLNEQANGVRGFKYALRFSQYGSHTKKLLDPQARIGNFAYNLRALGKRLGPVLVQLPRNWKMNPSESPARLDAFLRARPKDAKWAIELRHESWLCEPIFSVLRRRNVALCIHDNVDVEKHLQMLTADWTYVLFHGPRSGGVNTWSEGYGREELGGRADWIRKVLKQGKDVYAYFRNHNEGHAFHDALKRARVFQPKESKPKKQRGR
jgi:uncharacterized protein YecE (DUF72 family)